MSAIRTILFGLVLLTVACRRPSTQFAAMMTPVNQPADYGRYLKSGDQIIALGTDPGWSLAINPGKGTLRFKSSDKDSILATAPERQTDSDGTFRYSTLTNGERINIVFRPDSCVDKVSNQRFDYRVEVDANGKNYQGCGLLLQQLALLQDIWVLTSFQGKSIEAAGPRNEAPRLEISLTEGRVTGTTGCNRLSGSVKADTRLIQFGPLVTTKMACAGTAGQFEPEFLNALRESLAYQVADGKLTLLRKGEPVMVFKKVD
jgi:heat shock protein HslJ/uncharacterized membrane protein